MVTVPPCDNWSGEGNKIIVKKDGDGPPCDNWSGGNKIIVKKDGVEDVEDNK